MAELSLDQIGEIALQIMTAAKGYLTSKAGNTLGRKVWEKLRHISSGSEEAQDAVNELERNPSSEDALVVVKSLVIRAMEKDEALRTELIDLAAEFGSPAGDTITQTVNISRSNTGDVKVIGKISGHDE